MSAADRCSTCCAPGRNPARTRGPPARAAGGRARRHHPDRARHPRRPNRFTKQAGNHGGTRYPQLRLLALVACGTRTLIDAVFGPTTAGETTYAPRLLPSLRTEMILLADHNFAARRLLADIAATGAEVLVRLKNGRRMPVLARFPDGSYLSTLGDLRVRVIDCEITVTTSARKPTSLYRLATTLLDHQHHPAAELTTLYHQRWEIETAYLELKSTILGGRVLRARTPEGIDQEIYALVVVYQLLRTAMADATSTQPGTDPDRAGFSIAWQTARDQIILAAGIIADTVIDLAGTIGRHVLADFLPQRRPRVSPRIVKRAISKYQARGPRIDRTSYKATTGIEISTPAGP
ncbi:IS4 family transposase [Streptomyces sp. DB-54]